MNIPVRELPMNRMPILIVDNSRESMKIEKELAQRNLKFHIIFSTPPYKQEFPRLICNGTSYRGVNDILSFLDLYC